MILGFLLNFIFIILLGDYGLFYDGPLEEDSIEYAPAYQIACAIGTLNGCEVA